MKTLPPHHRTQYPRTNPVKLLVFYNLGFWVALGVLALTLEDWGAGLEELVDECFLWGDRRGRDKGGEVEVYVRLVVGLDNLWD